MFHRKLASNREKRKFTFELLFGLSKKRLHIQTKRMHIRGSRKLRLDFPGSSFSQVMSPAQLTYSLDPILSHFFIILE